MRHALLLAASLLLVANPATAQYVDITATSPDVELVDERRGAVGAGVCAVKGEARNLSARPLSLRVHWRAYDVQGAGVGTALVVLDGLPAGGRQTFESIAFSAGAPVAGAPLTFVPCHRVHRIERYRLEVSR